MNVYVYFIFLASIKVGNPFQKERIHIIIIKESLGY